MSQITNTCNRRESVGFQTYVKATFKDLRLKLLKIVAFQRRLERKSELHDLHLDGLLITEPPPGQDWHQVHPDSLP